MTALRPASRRWLILVVVQAALLTVFLGVDSPADRAFVGLAFDAVAVLVAVAGVLRARRDRAICALFVLALVATSAGDVGSWRLMGPSGALPYPSWVDVPYLVQTVLVLAGFTLAASVAGGRHPGAVLDTVLASSGLVVLSVQFGVLPVLGGDNPLETALSLAYAGSDILCIVLAAWCLVSGRRLTPGTWLVGAAAMVWYVTDLAYAVQQYAGTYAAGGVLDLGWYLTNALVAIACWTGFQARGRSRDTRRTRRRQLLAAGVTGVIGPVGLVLSTAVGVDVHPVALAVATVVPFIAAMWRMYGLVRTLEALASGDPLTGVLNRTAFAERGGQVIEDDAGITMVLCDLDGFKEINDTHGHAAGDLVLCELARRLQLAAGRGGVVGRLGGDEFAAVVPGDQLDVAELDAALRGPVMWGTTTLALRPSIGRVVVAAGQRPDLDAVMIQADHEMYVAKRRAQGEESRPGRRGSAVTAMPRQPGWVSAEPVVETAETPRPP